MKIKGINHSDQNQEFYKQFTRLVYTNRFIFGFLGASALIAVFFGVLVWFIAFGLFYGFMKLALTFDAPYRLLLQIFRLKDLPPHLIKLSLGQVLLSCATMIFPVFFVYVGMRVLYMVGFCSQNLICSLGRLVLP
jgi:hypothetical protein